jgi:hypothetical protein
VQNLPQVELRALLSCEEKVVMQRDIEETHLSGERAYISHEFRYITVPELADCEDLLSMRLTSIRELGRNEV